MNGRIKLMSGGNKIGVVGVNGGVERGVGTVLVLSCKSLIK
ncbi:hypothetical protein [Staphylococcus epidermidis]|nr:hypothetical protein [Staphylococcus epidermidis]